MVRRLFLLIALLMPLLTCAQEPTLFAPVPLAPVPTASGDLMVSNEKAARALALGFTATAAAQAEQVIAQTPAGGAMRDEAALILAAARLELGEISAAEQALANYGDKSDAAYRLRAGLIAARQARWPAAQVFADSLKAEQVVAEERAWIFFLQGQLAEASRDATKAAAAYDQSLEAASSEWQRARLQLTRERLRVAQGEATESQAGSLRDAADRYVGRNVGNDYALQYAVALAQLGRSAEAVIYLQGRLAALPPGVSAQDDFRLIIGMIAAPGQAVGRTALEQLLVSGANAAKQRMALYLLAENAVGVEARRRLREKLDELLQRAVPHVLAEEMLLVRADLALVALDYVQADADAKAQLARFPGSGLRARALTLLAGVAWDLKRFRSAADYAGQAAAATDEAPARAMLRLLAAEALYRAKDFLAAAAAYGVVLRDVPQGITLAQVLFQQCASEIGAERLDVAAELLDRWAANPALDEVTRWQAEWNLARALQNAGQREVALSRVTKLRADTDAHAHAPDLRARLAWLEARLAKEAGRPEEALKLARALPQEMAGVEPGLAREVAGLVRLVAAEALFQLGRTDEALAELRQMRADETGSEAMVQSYLVEADIQATTGGRGLENAQALLTQFAKDFSAHEYAPYALYQAALLAERRGDDAAYQQAYVLLEELVKKYGEGRLVFSARMKQGDLLRRLNQFPVAQQIYELLANRYAQHPDLNELLAAQMALADCHRAQAAQDASHFESAITILERLRDLASAPVDLRAEAGFKLGDMLAARDSQAALAVWWPVAQGLLLEPAMAEQLGARGRYWIGRLLVRMAGLHEEKGRRDEAGDLYRLLISKGLPGLAIARARLEAPIGESAR